MCVWLNYPNADADIQAPWILLFLSCSHQKYLDEDENKSHQCININVLCRTRGIGWRGVPNSGANQSQASFNEGTIIWEGASNVQSTDLEAIYPSETSQGGLGRVICAGAENMAG